MASGSRPRLGTGHLVVVEFAAACAVLTLRWPGWWAGALDVVAATTMVLAYTRVGGRWGYQQLALHLRLSRRHQARSSPAEAGEGRLAFLDRIGGPVQVRTVEHRGTQIGIGEDGTGWFAVIELAPRADLSAEAPTPVSSALLAELLGDRSAPGTVQVISRTVAAPTSLLPPGAPAVSSYRQLLDSTPVVAVQSTWIALRLDAHPASAHRLAYPDADAAELALAVTAQRASRKLTRAAIACRVLDGAGLTTALLRAAGLTQPRAGDAQADEDWGGWRTGGVTHACYGLHSWPAPAVSAPGGSAPLLDRLTTVPATATTVAVSLTRGPAGTRLGCLVRVCAPEQAIAAAGAELIATARQDGLELHRLDGQHGPAVYASLPTGAGWPGADGSVRLAAPTSISGIVLGRDSDGAPVPIRLFRAEPTEIALVGGGWAARLVAVRAIALGALVLVRTAYPDEWGGLGLAASGRDDRLVLLSAAPMPPVAAADHQPVLYIDDHGAGVVPARPGLCPWQSRMTVLRRLTPLGFPVAANAQVVLLQRLAAPEASAATSVLRLAGQTPHLLQIMEDDMLAVIGGGVNQYVWTNPTRWEVDHLGAPHRDGTPTVAPTDQMAGRPR